LNVFFNDSILWELVKASINSIPASNSCGLTAPCYLIYAEHRGSFVRAVVAHLGQELGTVRLNEVAARYGRDQVTLSLGTKRLRERLAQESDPSENIASLQKERRGGKAKTK
jgi:hypothetical protein